jgi:hypothetical protein
METKKIDLSPLDPSNDTQRWNELIESIVTRAIAIRDRELSFTYQLFAWARPAFALAAALAVFAIIGASFIGQDFQSRLNAKVKPAVELTVWATTNAHPSSAAIIELFGGSYGYK